jgi:hypothetical protein
VVRLEYPLDGPGSDAIQISWDGWWRDGVVRLREVELARLPDEKAFLRGVTATLPDGRAFTFRLVRGWNGQRYQAFVDGRDLTPPVPRVAATMAGGVAMVGLGALTLVSTAVLPRPGGPLGSIFAQAIGATLVLLGPMAIRGAKAPLTVAACVFGLEALLGLAAVTLGTVDSTEVVGVGVSALVCGAIAVAFVRWRLRANHEPGA